jgi:hypothetical protein
MAEQGTPSSPGSSLENLMCCVRSVIVKSGNDGRISHNCRKLKEERETLEAVSREAEADEFEPVVDNHENGGQEKRHYRFLTSMLLKSS